LHSSHTLTSNHKNNSSHAIDVTDDDDFDKIFNEFLNTSGLYSNNLKSPPTNENNVKNNLVYLTSIANSNNRPLPSTKEKMKKSTLKNVFKFFFKKNPKKSSFSENEDAKNMDLINTYNQNEANEMNEQCYEDDAEMECDEEYLMCNTNLSSVSNEPSQFKYDLELIKYNNEINLFSIDKELVRMKNNFREMDHFFIDSRLIQRSFAVSSLPNNQVTFFDIYKCFKYPSISFMKSKTNCFFNYHRIKKKFN
jgi:hypothetical protein